MRVALVCPYAWDAPGGVRVHIDQLAQHLERSGHRTIVLTPAFRHSAEAGVVTIGRPVRVPFNGSIAPVCPDPRTLGRVRAALETFWPDVVHVHEPFAPSTSMFAVLSSRAPVVATFHAYADRSRALAALAPLLRRVWTRLDVRLAVSGAAARFAGRHFEGPIRVVPNGVDVEMFRGAAPAELPSGRRILFVNRLERRKGFAVGVQTFRLLSERYRGLWFVVAGDGPDRDALQNLTRDVRDRVVMLGTVDHDALPAYYAAADLFLAPALGRESFGIVLVEALASGVPVVASNIPGYRDVVRDGVEGILVPPGLPADFAAAARRILDDPDLAGRLSAAGIERAGRYRWEVVAAEIESAYREAAALRAS
jgi:phosphatidyl-myo-inositol alpha-mannosyltransferase